MSPTEGDYQLILESSDKNSPLLQPAALKTDVISLTVYNNTITPIPPNFEHELDYITLTVGQKSEWTLPQVVNAYMNNYEIVMEPDLPLVPYLIYRQVNDTIKYNDRHGSEQLVGNFLKVRYRIVDSLGS